MKKIKLFLLFLSLNMFCMNVYAIDSVDFTNDCDFIPSNAYAVLNNGSHTQGTDFTSISQQDKNGVFVSSAYKIGNNYYRANKIRDVYFHSTYGSSIMFDFYPFDDNYKSGGNFWSTGVNYKVSLILGSRNGSKYDYRDVNHSLASAVGVVPSGNDYYVNPYNTSSYVAKNTFYTKNDDFQISVLEYIFTIKSKQMGNNKIIFNIKGNKDITEDIYILGFNIKGTTVSDFTSTEQWQDIPYENFDIYRKGEQKECYVGSLPSDIASPEEEYECDGVIDCTIKEIGSTFNKWLNEIGDLFRDLFVPNGETMSNLATDFMNWFDEKLGFLGQPITFTIDFLNRFINLNDTGHYVIHVPNINVPLFDYPIIQGFDYDLASTLQDTNINRIHTITFVIINGTIGIAFLILCGKKLDDILGQSHYADGESLSEYEGYSIDDKTGDVKKSHKIVQRTTYKKSNFSGKWEKK